MCIECPLEWHRLAIDFTHAIIVWIRVETLHSIALKIQRLDSYIPLYWNVFPLGTVSQLIITLGMYLFCFWWMAHWMQSFCFNNRGKSVLYANNSLCHSLHVQWKEYSFVLVSLSALQPVLGTAHLSVCHCSSLFPMFYLCSAYDLPVICLCSHFSPTDR